MIHLHPQATLDERDDTTGWIIVYDATYVMDDGVTGANAIGSFYCGECTATS